MRKLALASMIALLVTACLGSDFADSLEGTWQMTSGSVDGEEIPLLESHPITIHFEGTQLRGKASCNGYSGTFDLDGSTITIGPVAMTEMACVPEETMQAEAMFGQAITRVDTVTIDEALTLTGDGVEMVFERLEPMADVELTNTVWKLEGLISNDAVSTPVLGTNATVEFFTDGSMLGDTGCRPFSARYTLSGAEVVVEGIAADGHECDPDVAGQDTHFLTVIGDGFTAEIDGDRLTATGRDGIGLAFVAG